MHVATECAHATQQRAHVRRCAICDYPRIQARALKLGGRDVNLGLYIGIHNKRQDIIYSEYLQMKSHNQI